MNSTDTPISEDEKAAEQILIRLIVPALLMTHPDRNEIVSVLREELSAVEDRPVAALALERLEKLAANFDQGHE
ncbi:hypothetical protein V6R97_08360 [Chromohalobacter salexigens]|uniref:hypothetical protein n=1 Tax=Chromohalobacter israelensis TaxID=141390 RepID=UPI0032E8A6BF